MRRWKPVCGYENYYEISDDGIVRSVDRIVIKSNGVLQHRSGKIKIQTKNKDGYLTVNLSKDGNDKRCPVHTLVAQAFVDGYIEGYEVNHKDFNRLNNRYDNLEWVTHKKNVSHSKNSGRYCIRDFKGTNNPNYGNDTLKKKYAENKELSKIKNSRPGASNGKSRRVRLFISDDEYKDFGYITGCAIYMINNNMVRSANINNVSVNISSAATKNKYYSGYRFEFI